MPITNNWTCFSLDYTKYMVVLEMIDVEKGSHLFPETMVNEDFNKLLIHCLHHFADIDSFETQKRFINLHVVIERSDHMVPHCYKMRVENYTRQYCKLYWQHLLLNCKP